MKRTRKLGAAMTMAVMLALALAVTSVRLEAKGDGHDGGTTALCAALLSAINNMDFPQAIRDASQQAFDLLGCS